MDDKCFALSRRKHCIILTVPACPGESCPFYKNWAEFKEDRQEANRRLASLDPATQRYIADKYYDGNMPWIDGGEAYGC